MRTFLPPGGARTAVMGILNVTPDSFSDGGRYLALSQAVDRARQMADEGADLIDVGGESTRPGAPEVVVAEEVERAVPVISAIAGLGVPISIDTRKAAVARAAIDAGACMVNDVSGGTFDEEMLPLLADSGAAVVLMHMRGTPQTMDDETSYGDVVADVRSELAERVAAAARAGVGTANIFVDPGLGFAKTREQSLELVRRIEELRDIGLPLVVGPSRKRFLGGELQERDDRTLAVSAWCASHGVDVLRVHAVGGVRRVVDTIAAVRSTPVRG